MVLFITLRLFINAILSAEMKSEMLFYCMIILQLGRSIMSWSSTTCLLGIDMSLGLGLVGAVAEALLIRDAAQKDCWRGISVFYEDCRPAYFDNICFVIWTVMCMA